MTREEELACQAVSPAPNFSFQRRVGGQREEAGLEKVGPAVPSPPWSRGSGMPIRTRLG